MVLTASPATPADVDRDAWKAEKERLKEAPKAEREAEKDRREAEREQGRGRGAE